MLFVMLPSFFSDHMVLQRSAETAVWGRGAPGERVAIYIADRRAETVTDDAGRWRVNLDLRQSGPGPFNLRIEGHTMITFADVLVGEVWLCSGQSNIAFTLNRAIGAEEEMRGPMNPCLRQFRVENHAADAAEEDCRGSWIVASPDTAAMFSAVAYFFAKELHARRETPVGIILATVPGTVAGAWISPEATRANDLLAAQARRSREEEAGYPVRKAMYVKAMPAWQAANTREDCSRSSETFLTQEISASHDWKNVQLPADADSLGLPSAGAVWFRRVVTLPENLAGKVVTIDPGGPHDFNTIYWNDHKIGGMDVANTTGKIDTRRCIVPPEIIAAGDNALAIRLFTPSENGGFTAAPFLDIGGRRVSLTKDWQARTEFALPPLTEEARRTLPVPPETPDPNNVSSRLFNGMISSLIPATLAGVIWYQGEQDTGRSRQDYFAILKALIEDWRARWDIELPIVICQLPSFGPKQDSPGESPWAEIRQAQFDIRRLPRTAVVVLIDLGELDVHPPDKKPVGQRVAQTALGAFYGEREPWSGPVFASMKRDGAQLLLAFTSIGDGLTALPLPDTYQPTFMASEKVPLVRHNPRGEIEGFAVRAADEKWKWAEARIENNVVVVHATNVLEPVAVRYAWANNPTCNLANSTGLPAAPFEAILEPEAP